MWLSAGDAHATPGASSIRRGEHKPRGRGRRTLLHLSAGSVVRVAELQKHRGEIHGEEVKGEIGRCPEFKAGETRARQWEKGREVKLKPSRGCGVWNSERYKFGSGSAGVSERGAHGLRGGGKARREGPTRRYGNASD